MNYQVGAEDARPLRLNETDTVASILQNVSIVLATRQGTVPMDRALGLPQKFLDKPVPVAKAMAYAEIKEAVEAYEPRAEVVDVIFREDAAVPGKLLPVVEVKMIDG